jgi:hypothetical protein
MNEASPKLYTAFSGQRRFASGSLHAVTLAVKRRTERSTSDPVLIFDDQTGRTIDVDLRGTEEQVVARLSPSTQADAFVTPPVGVNPLINASRGRGRPKLGVVAREVTLLPRHWEWLNSQPGGASVALRKLVEEARRVNRERDENRRRQEAAYHFMSAMAGDLPGFEEATRALFAHDRRRFHNLAAAWPADVCDHIMMLAYADAGVTGSEVLLP